MNKFSDIIYLHTKMWWDWMKHDSIARDKTLDYKTRKKSVKKCEELIKQKYELMEKINSFFEKCK
jgi:hypothetical protein